jgi:hypothetical protein
MIMKKKKEMSFVEYLRAEKEYVETAESKSLNPYDDPNFFITKVFESEEDHDARFLSGEIYNDEYFKKCRDYALKVDKYDPLLRAGVLSSLKQCVPLHARGYVFNGIQL